MKGLYLQRVFLRGVGAVLVPTDTTSGDALDGLKNLAFVKVDIKADRSLPHHRLFRALLQKVVEAGANYVSADALLVAIKEAQGYYDTVQALDGNVIRVVKSTSFEAMDQAEFRQFFERSIQLICEHILPGIEPSDLKDEIFSIMNGQAMEPAR